MRHPKFRERISEEPQEMLEKERCYVTRCEVWCVVISGLGDF